MKYLKLFENHKNEEDIHSICKDYGIKNYSINDDLSIDVDGYVDLHDKGLTKLPLKFNKVDGYFNCTFNNLKSLEGAPKEVNGDFYCYKNDLTSLEGSPNKVNGDFHCILNILTSLEGASKEVTGNFYCSNNQLYSFYSLTIDVGGKFYYGENPIACFGNLLGFDSELIYEFNELYVIQQVDGIWSIYKHRMEEFVDMFERPEPNYKEIEKYYKILD
jgi:hypothetical protein